MAGPRFRLAALLSQHEATRHECRALLAETLLEERRLKSRRHALLDQIETQHQQRRHNAKSGLIDPSFLAELQRYERELAAELASVDQSLAATVQELDRRQQALAAANSQVRGLEILREAERNDFVQRIAAGERNALDEAAAQLTIRKAA